MHGVGVQDMHKISKQRQTSATVNKVGFHGIVVKPQPDLCVY